MLDGMVGRITADRFFGWLKGFGLIGIHLGALAAFWPGFFQWPALIAAAVVGRMLRGL